MARFSFLSTYPPTRCGLATFTEALATAMAVEAGTEASVVRMMDELARPAVAGVGTRSSIVAELGSVTGGDEAALRHAARALSRSDVAVVQHEYGIFGGVDGADAVAVLAYLTVPSIVVLHTVLDAPTEGQARVLEQVADLASAVVVMTATARHNLEQHYTVDLAKVSVVPHGVAAWTRGPARSPRTRRTVLTWGLIGPGKGIEHGIRAMAALGETDPLVHYVVHGQTHPKVLAHQGEAYREQLHALVTALGLQQRVTIDDAYLDPGRLAAQVDAADLVLLPYDSRNQVTSGVLVEAVAAGKPVVATAFPHAVELLGAGTGIVVAHEDPEAIAAGIRRVLGWLGTPRSRPARPAPETSWAEVAHRYGVLAAALTSHPVGQTA